MRRGRHPWHRPMTAMERNALRPQVADLGNRYRARPRHSGRADRCHKQQAPPAGVRVDRRIGPHSDGSSRKILRQILPRPRRRGSLQLEEKIYRHQRHRSMIVMERKAQRPKLADSDELQVSTLTRRRRFSGPVTGALCKLPFAGFVEKCRVRGKRPLPDNFRRFRKTGAEWPQFKTATVRERPPAACRSFEMRTFGDLAEVQPRPVRVVANLAGSDCRVVQSSDRSWFFQAPRDHE